MLKTYIKAKEKQQETQLSLEFAQKVQEKFLELKRVKQGCWIQDQWGSGRPAMHNLEKYVLNKTPFAIATKALKYLGANLTSNMEYTHEENNATLLKKIKEYLNNMYTMFIDGKAQYHEGVNSPQINLQIQIQSKASCGTWQADSKRHI